MKTASSNDELASEKIEVVQKESANSTSDSPSDALPDYEDEIKPRLTWQMALAFIALTMQFNAYILTLLIPSTTLAEINRSIGPSLNYSWVTISWTLAASITVSVSGRLSDIFGRRYFMLGGACIALVGCIVGATGQNINQMIASGVILGTGSGIQEMAYACIQEIVPNSWRLYAIGLFDLMAIISFCGPLIAWSFIGTTSVGWRGAYYFMTGFHAAALVLLFFAYHPPTFQTKHRIDGKTKLQLVKEMDFVGLFLFAGGCILFLLGINYGGKQYPWKDAHVIAPIVTGVLSLVALGFWEAYADLAYPLMPPRLFKRWRQFTMVLIVCFVGGMLYYSMNVLWPRQSQLLYTGPDPIQKGLYAEMIPLGTTISAFITIFICANVGHERWQLVAFTIIQTALIGSLSTVGLDSKKQAIATIICLSSTVTPPQLMSFTMLSLGIDDQTDIGIAVGLAGTFRLLGGAIATAVYTAVINNGFSSAIAGDLESNLEVFGITPASSTWPAFLKAAELNTAAAYKNIPGITQSIIDASGLAVKQAYVSAFSTTYLVAIAFGVMAIIASACTSSIDLKAKHSGKAVQLENDKSDVPNEKVVV
ncbi:hypothetical protein VE01_01764 [Pseudogymnoascus verrucosus]|uniref:Major facilitator superfamily (MFS) profile domain-containing protein n=1 Tax=Pseudogymnoascus verrucosus TaxID=342668 RepID=A0A1B8GWJ7_9PEZI|nr:uncharacterized protein VE01_01764 [Pseudogymnoascus verrucosus]OBU00189.1 hypothetical protein VE01_01764 [Pseudogymnoascus verrucosus]